jgi:hypothetical protein
MGKSDIQDDWVLNEELNEQLLSYKDNADYHGNPLTLMYGISAKNLEKGAGKVWGNLPTDGKIENLEVTQTFEMVQIYMDMLFKYSGLASIPTYILSLDKELTADTSNAAMRLAFLPAIEYTNIKKLTYGAGLKEVMEKSLRMLNIVLNLSLEVLNTQDSGVTEKLQVLGQKYIEMGVKNAEAILNKISQMRMHPYYECKVTFKDHLPRNRALELVDIQTEMGMGLESLEGALVRLGVTDIEAKKSEIQRDMIYQAKIDRLKAIIADTANPIPENLTNDEVGEDAIDGQVYQPTEVMEGTPTETSPIKIEEDTGQSAERTMAQRALQGKGGI